MPFEQAHQSFIENHHARRTGERKSQFLDLRSSPHSAVLELSATDIKAISKI